jgi:hypothetical protein
MEFSTGAAQITSSSQQLTPPTVGQPCVSGSQRSARYVWKLRNSPRTVANSSSVCRKEIARRKNSRAQSVEDISSEVQVAGRVGAAAIMSRA